MAKLSEIQVQADELQRALAKAQRDEFDLHRVMGEIALIIKSSIDENFNVGGRYGSGPYGGGSERWPLSHRVREEGGITLTDTAHLKASIVVVPTPRGVVVSSAREDFPTHHFGDRREIWGGPMIGIFPPRPIAVVQDEDIEEIQEVISRNAEKIIGFK